MKKICYIVGARPQFVKYLPMQKAARSVENLLPVLIHTGQHYDYNMSKIFFDELGIGEPDYHLGVGSGSHAAQTAQALVRIEELLLKEKPDAVVVFGDTNATLSGTMAAVKLHLPVVHIEAGLRSDNRDMPEEINRVLTDHASSMLFCPSRSAALRLAQEGLPAPVNAGHSVSAADHAGLPPVLEYGRQLVVNAGDVMFDVLLQVLPAARERSRVLQDLHLREKQFGLLTLHRAENTDDPVRLKKMIEFINGASGHTELIFPIHPRTKKMLDMSGAVPGSHVRIIEPVGYFDLVTLLRAADFLLTDSGGMQKEAYWLQVPCVTLRDETEWGETVTSGWNTLYGNFKGAFAAGGGDRWAYGRGSAAPLITEIMTGLL